MDIRAAAWIAIHPEEWKQLVSDLAAKPRNFIPLHDAVGNPMSPPANAEVARRLDLYYNLQKELILEAEKVRYGHKN